MKIHFINKARHLPTLFFSPPLLLSNKPLSFFQLIVSGARKYKWRQKNSSRAKERHQDIQDKQLLSKAKEAFQRRDIWQWRHMERCVRYSHLHVYYFQSSENPWADCSLHLSDNLWCTSCKKPNYPLESITIFCSHPFLVACTWFIKHRWKCK